MSSGQSVHHACAEVAEFFEWRTRVADGGTGGSDSRYGRERPLLAGATPAASGEAAPVASSGELTWYRLHGFGHTGATAGY